MRRSPAAVRDRSDPDPAVRARSNRYAASTRIVCEALAAQAKQMTKPAPLLSLLSLTGKFAPFSPRIRNGTPLMQPEASLGLGLVTNGNAMGETADSGCFPDEKGYYVYVNRGGELTAQLQNSDVVCFRSAPADADGYHSLIRVNGIGTYVMPPLATVTLASVQQPGEWEVCGHKVKRRLFTVSVSYK